MEEARNSEKDTILAAVFVMNILYGIDHPDLKSIYRWVNARKT